MSLRITVVNRMMGILRGGGEFFDLNMARALTDLGAEVRFVVGRRVRRLDEAVEEFPTRYIATPYLRGFEYRYRASRLRLLQAAAGRARRLDDHWFGRAALGVLAEDDWTDVFQFCTLPTTAAALAKQGRKTVVWWPGPPSRAAMNLVGKCSGCFSHGVSLARAREFDGSVACIEPGCDTTLFRPASGRGAQPGCCRFIFVGRCIPVKNLTVLVDGFARAQAQRPGLRLTIVGDGEMLPDLKAKVRALGLTECIDLPGFQSGEALAEQYRRADCFVLVSEFESFSIVTQEAMSSGLPVILTRTGYLPTFVEKYQAGSLVEVGDAAGLAEAMGWWADRPEERARVGARNRAVVEREFSWRASARKLLDYYESLVTKV